MDLRIREQYTATWRLHRSNLIFILYAHIVPVLSYIMTISSMNKA